MKSQDQDLEKKLIAELTSAERARLAWMIRLLRRNRKLGLAETHEEYREDCHYFTRTCYLHIRAKNMIKKYTKKEDLEPYILTAREPEDDACHVVGRFVTLDSASEYIQERWQGVDYIITTHSFCTDYAVYTLLGFSLDDIGTFVEEPGKNWRCYSFNHNPPKEGNTLEWVDPSNKILVPPPFEGTTSPSSSRVDAVRKCYEGRSEPIEPDMELVCPDCGTNIPVRRAMPVEPEGDAHEEYK